jgi:glutaredoxin-related protein
LIDYSRFSKIPQFYLNGKLIGDPDILDELEFSGEL